MSAHLGTDFAVVTLTLSATGTSAIAPVARGAATPILTLRGRCQPHSGPAARAYPPSMDSGDWIALGSAVIALGAVIVAVLSWHQARLSAAEARRSADAAERSAIAEERAVDLAKRAEEDRQTPRLDYVAEGRAGEQAHIAVRLREGPPEIDIRTIGVWIIDASHPGERATLIVDTRTTTRVAGTGRHLVRVDLRSHTAELAAEIVVECRDPRDDRTWTCTDTMTFPAKPHGPATPLVEPPPTPPRGLFRNVGNFDEAGF